MKKIIISVAICISILLSGTGIAQASCFASCTSEDGYNVQILSDGNGWEMNIYHDGILVGNYSGDGPYTGTACEGYAMCNISDV